MRETISESAHAHQDVNSNGAKLAEQGWDVEQNTNASGYTRMELSPQPSDDPDDPLNWPLWLKVRRLHVMTVAMV